MSWWIDPISIVTSDEPTLKRKGFLNKKSQLKKCHLDRGTEKSFARDQPTADLSRAIKKTSFRVPIWPAWKNSNDIELPNKSTNPIVIASKDPDLRKKIGMTLNPVNLLRADKSAQWPDSTPGRELACGGKVRAVLTLFTCWLFFKGVHELPPVGFGYFCAIDKLRQQSFTPKINTGE